MKKVYLLNGETEFILSSEIKERERGLGRWLCVSHSCDHPQKFFFEFRSQIYDL